MRRKKLANEPTTEIFAYLVRVVPFGLYRNIYLGHQCVCLVRHRHSRVGDLHRSCVF